MLHAGAHNPWINVRPGMTFGVWGTQWTPGQTWWESGGAKELFHYLAHCQAILQRGVFVEMSNDGDVHWIHRRDGGAEIYFVSNTSNSDLATTLELEVGGMKPEIWDAETLSIADASAWKQVGSKTHVKLKLTAHKSLFVIFRSKSRSDGPGLDLIEPRIVETLPINSEWKVDFPTEHPKQIKMSELSSWHKSEDIDIKYFSGTAHYYTTIELSDILPEYNYILDLGTVDVMARLYVNGEECKVMWRPPFRADVKQYLQKGKNEIDVEVTNLWVNRLIGDEQYESDILWETPSSPRSRGRYMLEIPEWLSNGTTRPSKDRKAVSSYNFFSKYDNLVSSGLIGPVGIEISDP